MNGKKGQGSMPTYKVKVEKNLWATMRDGVRLSADIYRPDSDCKFPVLVLRTPYNKMGELPLTETEFFPPRGYVVVLQDTRGRFGSEGEFYPLIYEGQDGYDTIEWAAELPWSNGIVGTVGQSYLGLVQYAVASTRPPHLKAQCPVSGPVTLYADFIYHTGGALELGWILPYFIFMAFNTAERKALGADFLSRLKDFVIITPKTIIPGLKDFWYHHLPVMDWGRLLGEASPFFEDFLKHPTQGPYWWFSELGRQYQNTNTPMLHVGSWYDSFQYDTLTQFCGIQQHAMTPETRSSQKLLMGPWAHLLPYSVPTTRGTGDIDFGPESRIELHEIQVRWFDYWLKGIKNGIMEEPPIRIFVMGNNVWRDEYEWPLARTQYTPYYFRSKGKANSDKGDGILSPEPPADEPADHYIYDPYQPVPTLGGNTLGIAMGVFDQRPVESMPNVLVYTSPPLEKDLEVTGPIRVELFASSSAPDTDFTAKLVDVRPDGYGQNIADGIIRARYRNSLTYPSLLRPGEIYEFTIDLWATSHVFKTGHRIRVDISSSNFPRFDRNPNTGNRINTDRELRSAEQRIFHDSKYPSHILLPVIPG
ncbi:MAG: hypothetical protein A3G93_08225 [Nitrospinae bacterium RIFCSPLOWO2_12_FULL_45_22]|nr:MAG: hypothetical protein A3G93_08225 [Nitrospinae bacterium RIFCSPLOWO2_12_FULL_45_22]